MRYVKPKVFLIAKTQLDTQNVNSWLNELDAEPFSQSEKPIGSTLTTLAGKRCYLSYKPGLNPNVVKVRNDLTAFIDNILSTGHGSVLEHVNYTFAIENVSRVFTSEMNRHRAGIAISEGSLRFIRFNDLKFWLPDSIKVNKDDSIELKIAKEKTKAIFDKAISQMEQNYAELLKIWDIESLTEFKTKKKLTSLFRRIIGMGVTTGGVWTGNLRALRHIFTMRCTPEAEEEICLVASLMLEKMVEAEPDIFADFYKENGYWKPKFRKV